MQFTNDGLTFDVREYGADGPETVALLHGFPEDAQSWDGVASRLATEGYRVLVPTQRGYSPTARPRRRRDYQMSAVASDVEALLDAAGVDRVHLVGHDWGGAVAWAVAAARPERLRTICSVSTPHPQALARSMVTSSQGLKSAYFVFFQLPYLPEALIRAAGVRRGTRALVRGGVDEATARRYAEALREPGAATGALNWYRGLPFDLLAQRRRPTGGGSGSTPGREERSAAWKRLPTLYVWGTRDAYLGRKAAELTADYVPGPYTFAVMEGASHWIPENHPAALTQVLLTHMRAAPAS
ncbi:MAG: alpha/beta fold hydrolase [Frankia sp.]